MSNFNIINSSSFRFVLDGFHENDPGLIAVFAEIDPGSVYPSVGAFLFDDAVIIDGAGNNIVFNSSTALLSFIELDENGDVVGSVASGLPFEDVLGFLDLVPNENDEVMIDINDDMIVDLQEQSEGEEEIPLPTYDEYIGSWNADVSLEMEYAQLFNYYSNPEEVDGVMLYGAMVLAHYFGAEQLEGSLNQLEAAEEAKEVPHEGWAGQELHENHMDLKQALNDALMSLGGGEGGMAPPDWTPSTYAAQWVVPDGYVLSDYNDYNAMPEGGLSLVDSDDDGIPDLWWLHHIATHADAMGLEGLVDQVNPGLSWMEAIHKAMDEYQNYYPDDLNENHGDLYSALEDALFSGEGSGGMSQEDYGVLWAESGDGNYWYQAWDLLESGGFPGDIPLNTLQNMLAGLDHAWNSFDESITTSVPPSPTAHQQLMAATQDAINAFASESSVPVTHTVNISNETLTLGPDLFTAQPIHDVMIIANSSEELTAIKLTLGDSWGDGWGATLRLSDPDDDQTVIYTHDGPPNVSGNGVGNSEDVEVNITAAPMIEQGGQFARNVRFQLSPTGSFDNDVSVTIASLGSQDNQPVEDNTPPDNTPYALFNIDLLNPSSNQYGGVPTVLGNDISISSAGDLLVAVDLQLGFSETGKQAILDEVMDYYAQHNSLPHATSDNPVFQTIIRSEIDDFISEGHNLDLWFGLGEQDLSVYASDAGGNFPQDHHDALVRYGQSDGFNASPPPQSIWPSGAEYVDIGGLLQNYFDFLLVAPTLEDGSPDFAQLDFSGKIVLPTLTYEIDPEQNNPGSGSAKVRLVAARNQNDAYALDYDVAQFPDGTPFLNPQYAAVDVQSVNFPLSNNNNENNDSQQGENNMSYNIQNSPDVENPLKQTITITGIDQTVLDSAPEVMLDWAEQVYPNPIALNLNSTLGGIALGDDFTFQIQITMSESGGSDEYEIFIDGSSIGSGYMPSWTGSVDGNTGLQIDLMGDYNAPNGVFDTEHTTHTFQFAGEEAGDPNANVDVPDGNTPSEGDGVSMPIDISTVYDGDNVDHSDNVSAGSPHLRGPRARQLRYDKFAASGAGFSIDTAGALTDGDMAQHVADGMAVAATSGDESHIVTIQSHMQDQDMLLHKLGQMISGGGSLEDGSSLGFEDRSSLKAMIDENRSDQNDMQTALSLADGDTAFVNFHRAETLQELDQTAIDNLAPLAVTDPGLDQDAEYGALKRYDDDGDLAADLEAFQALTDDDARFAQLDAVHGKLVEGQRVREADGSFSDAIAGSHFDESMDLEEIARKLDAGLIDADVDLSQVRDALGISDGDSSLDLANPAGTVLGGTSLSVHDAIEDLDLGIIASNSRILDIENWQSSGLRWRSSKATKQKLALEMIARQESGDQKENEAHYVRSEDKIFVHVATAGTENEAGDNYDFKPSSDWDEDSSLGFGISSASNSSTVISLRLKDLRGASGEALELEVEVNDEADSMTVVPADGDTPAKLLIKTSSDALLPVELKALADSHADFEAEYSALLAGEEVSVPSDKSDFVFGVAPSGTIPGEAYRYAVDGFQSDGITEFTGGFIVTMDYSDAMDTFSGHSLRIGTLETEMDEVEHDISDIAGALGLTLEDIAGTNGVAFSFPDISGGTSIGVLDSATDAQAAFNALNAEAAEASDERDNIATILGMDSLADGDLQGGADDNLVFDADSVIDALNKLHVWRTSELQYKPAVAVRDTSDESVSGSGDSLESSIKADATREIGDTYWVTGQRTRYTIMGFDEYEADADGNPTTTPLGNYSITVGEGSDVAEVVEVVEVLAVPATATTWGAPGSEPGQSLADLYPSEFASAGGDPDATVPEGSIVEYVAPVAPVAAVPSADLLVNISITQSEEMDEVDMQAQQDALELEVYKLKTGYAGLNFKMARPTTTESDLYDFISRSVATGGMGLDKIGFGKVLVNGILVGFINRESVAGTAGNGSMIPCGDIPIVFPGDDVVVEHSDDKVTDMEDKL